MVLNKGLKILLVGASGDLGFCVFKMLMQQDVTIGAHYHKNRKNLDKEIKASDGVRVKVFQSDVSSQTNSSKLVKSFSQWAGGIDCLIQLSGSVKEPKSLGSVDQQSWNQDIAVNLSGPFFLAQEAMKGMKKKGGKVIFTSTASASHGGGRNTMAYGCAKASIECLTKGLAREGAKHNILVNAIAPGFIMTKFHTKQMKRSQKNIKERANMVPLKRAGEPEDISSMIQYLLSPRGNYITGQILTISGGDWL